MLFTGTTLKEMSLSENKTVPRLCELKRTQILQLLASAVLKIPYAGYLLSGNHSNFIDYEGNVPCYYTCTKNVSPFHIFDDKKSYQLTPIFYLKKYIS